MNVSVFFLFFIPLKDNLLFKEKEKNVLRVYNINKSEIYEFNGTNEMEWEELKIYCCKFYILHKKYYNNI